MAFFGKTFKIYEVGQLPTVHEPTNADFVTALTSKRYIRDISLCAPILPASSPNPGYVTGMYAPASGIINPSAAQQLDAYTLQWQTQGVACYDGLGDDTTRDNILSLYPYAQRYPATKNYIIWDDRSTWCLGFFNIIYNNWGIVVYALNVNTGAALNSVNGVTNFGWFTRLVTWPRVRIYPTFYKDGRLYQTTVANDNSSSYGFTWTTFTSYTLNSEQAASFWAGYSLDYKPILIDNDPYAPGGDAEAGGGTGTFDNTSTAVPIPALPALSAVDAGFISLYKPALSQINALAEFMWSSLFDLDTFKKIFSDPMQAIIGLSILPGPIAEGTSKNVILGNIDSGVSMPLVYQQYVEIDCGTLNLEEFWGAYLDYEPYTKTELYLPYIGIKEISTDDVMGKSVHVLYHMDVLSGACTAFVEVDGTVLYSFMGMCGTPVPVTGNDWSNVLLGIVNFAAGAGTAVISGNPMGALEAANSINSTKPVLEKSGHVSGSGGLMSVQTPYVILTRPKQALPNYQNTYTGYPSFMNASLDSLKGFTQIYNIKLEGVPGTLDECNEIVELLKGGVIF